MYYDVIACCQVKRINKEKQRAVYRDVMQKLDRLENEFLPQVELDTAELRFGDVTFMEPQTHLITLRNTGQVRLRPPRYVT